MIAKGTTAINRATGSRWEVLEGAAETGARGFSIKVTCPAGAAPDVMEHIHQEWEESFEIVQGDARYSLGGAAGTATSGDTVRMPPRIKHVHPWNGGDESLVYIQRAVFPAPQPGALEDTFGVFFTLFGMAEEPGRLTKSGLPRNPLVFAAAGRVLGKYNNFDAALPIAAQKIAAATVGRLALALGAKAIDPAYIEKARPRAGE